jgi:CheY-like chemotaxis protein
VHGIVGDLGGGIAVESQPGEGALFTVFLPAQSYVAAPAAAEEAIAPGQGETVLLVDDEEALVRLGEETLAELGYEPVGFSSSAAALEAFRADPDRFQLVLSDEAMPGMTGSELVAEIRRLRPTLPVVLMSGYVTPALGARARECASPSAAKPLRRDRAQLRAPAGAALRPTGLRTRPPADRCLRPMDRPACPHVLGRRRRSGDPRALDRLPARTSCASPAVPAARSSRACWRARPST